MKEWEEICEVKERKREREMRVNVSFKSNIHKIS
jgi:hypothetical protein